MRRISCLILALILAGSGCDVIYGFLQKEGAEERELVGDLIPGAHNPTVQKAQKLLDLYGYNPGLADGKMGAKTRTALAEFQKDHGLKVSRFIDKATWKKLTLFSNSQLVVGGEVNIFAVQMALKNAGFDPGKVDGKSGPRTEEALREFQRKKGLAVDGKIGPATLKKLLPHVPVKPPR